MVRFKNRWLLVELIPTNLPLDSTARPSPLDSKKVYSALKQSILTNFGDTGWGAVGLSLTVKYFSPMTNVAIIRVGRDQHRIAWGGITLLKEIDNWKIIPYVVHVSGTIKHAQLAAIEHNREVVARIRARSKSPGIPSLSVRTVTGSMPFLAHYKDSYTQFLETTEREIGALQD